MISGSLWKTSDKLPFFMRRIYHRPETDASRAGWAVGQPRRFNLRCLPINWAFLFHKQSCASLHTKGDSYLCRVTGICRRTRPISEACELAASLLYRELMFGGLCQGGWRRPVVRHAAFVAAAGFFAAFH